MRRRRQGWTICAVVLLVGLLGSSTVLAQNTGSITGRAEDDTGGVLPGVAVTATSPVLIEQSRETVTDGTGRFNITELPPGLYEVRFILGGFSTFVIEAIDLSAGVTATANAVMAVGALEETVTVTGATPVVDI